MCCLKFFILLSCFFLASEPMFAQQPKTEKPKQFIYVLHLVPRLYDDKSWTEQDKAAVGRVYVFVSQP